MQSKIIGIRREDKNRWERRAPLTPEGVGVLVREGLEVRVQASSLRAYTDQEYLDCGARIVDDLEGCDIVFAVKEIPIPLLRNGKMYVFFSHTVKGQHHNMPMLRALVERQCTLVDYERVVDDRGRRMIFFGWHAGAAGMIATLHLLGRRLEWLGYANPFLAVQPAHTYPDLATAMDVVHEVGHRLSHHPLPPSLAPFVVGFTGYGNVSQGAQHVFQCLPTEEVTPSELSALRLRSSPPADRLFKVVFKEEHLVEPLQGSFDLQEYFQHPERYRGVFERHVPHLDVLVNGIFWTEAYPRLLTLDLLRRHQAEGRLRLKVIGDISCDIDGSVECTVKSTEPDCPSFVYDPATGAVSDGHEGRGVAVMAVDNLPCEIPKESTRFFSSALVPHVEAMATADYDGGLDALHLPPPIRRALILFKGEFTPEYRYMERFLQ